MITLNDIYRFPVKSLSPQHLDTADLYPGEGLAHDRRYALAPGSTQLSGTTTEWISKTHFLVLVRHEKLAELETTYDEQSNILTVNRRGKQVSRGNLEDPVGRTVIEEFFTAFMGEKSRGQIKVAKAADGHSLEDQPTRLVSIINLATLRDLERVTGSAIEPLRFRGNLYIDTGEPWQEFNWTDRNISIDDVTLSIGKRTGRCAATHINPATAKRDINLLKALQQGFAHTDCGVFGTVISGGTIRRGSEVIV